MGKQVVKYFTLGIILILLSAPLGYGLFHIVFGNSNLTGEYEPLLKGSIHSFMLIGALIFSIGIVNLIKGEK